MTFAFAAGLAVALLVAAAGKAAAGERRLPLVETLLAAWLLSGATPVAAAAAAALFFAGCAATLVPMAVTDPNGDCGCFGVLGPASPLRALNRTGALLMASVISALIAAAPAPAGILAGVALVVLWRSGEVVADRLRAAAVS